MTANLPDEKKQAAARKAQRTAQQRENPRRRRGQVAEQMVRDWSPDKRARVRGILLGFLDASDPDVIHAPEMQVVALIDRVSAE